MVDDNNTLVGLVDVDPNIDKEKEAEIGRWGIYVSAGGGREGRWGIFIDVILLCLLFLL